MKSREGDHIMCFSPICGRNPKWGNRRVVLVYREHDSITPYVVSAKYDACSSWDQGHYFTNWADAAEFFNKHSIHYLKRHENAF